MIECRMAEVLSTFMLKPGDKAPDFSLPDYDGIIISRADAAGPAGLLVVFACNHCPFVVHLADALGDFAREIEPLEIGTVAITSNDIEKYPQDGPEPMKRFAAEHRWEFPYLLDESQEVARAYGAACTPDFFLFGRGGVLFYTGQFDDSRPRSGLEPHGGDLREAVRRMLGGEGPLERPYPSSGCNIKLKPGNEPAWWNSGT
jgi:peroxiredoxin